MKKKELIKQYSEHIRQLNSDIETLIEAPDSERATVIRVSHYLQKAITKAVNEEFCITGPRNTETPKGIYSLLNDKP